MRKYLLSFCFILLMSSFSLGQTDIWTHTFESSGGYTTSITEFTNGSEDYFLRTDGADIISSVTFTNLQGNYFFGAQDIDAEGATLPVTLTFDDIDISDNSDLIFYVYLAEDDDGTNQDWDEADYVHIQYDIDNSGTFTDLIWIQASGGTNTEPAIDTDFDGTGEGTAITDAFAEFNNTITGTGSVIDIKVTFSLNSGDEDIALDNFRLAGTPAAGTPIITISTTSLTGFEYVEGSGPSAEQTFTVSGSDLTNDISVTPPTNYEISLTSGGSFVATNPITLTQSGGSVSETTVYVRLKSGLSAGAYNGETITASSTGASNKTVTCGGTVYKQEPANHATSFAATANGQSQIDLSWTDAAGSPLPDGYLIRANKIGTFSDPVDGVSETDNTDSNGGVINITQGVESYNWTGLDSGTQYFFKIWPYTNSGSQIDYKTDGTVPTDDATTDAFTSLLLLEENFLFTGNLTDNGWTAHSGSGDNPIATTTGLTYTGYVSSELGNAANVSNTGEDVSREFSAQTSGSIYASFLINVNSATPGYFIHFNTNPASFNYKGRVFILSDGSGDFEIGLSYTSSSASAQTDNDYSFGTTYLVVLKYTFVSGSDNDEVLLYVFTSGVPSTEPGTPTISVQTGTGEPTNIGAISLRQFNSSQDIVVDGIRVSNAWDQGALPVELTSFTASAIKNTVKLAWNTATEINNYGFEIQRSTDEEVWNNVGFVNGNGTTNSPKDYYFVDDKLSNAGSYYYRLKQVDNDGSYEFSKTIEVVIGTPTAYKLDQNYPNPFNPSTLISFTLPEAGFTNLVIFNSLGQEIATLVNDQLDAGTHQYNFNAKNLTSGIYFYKLESDNFVQVRKMMLLK